MLDTRDATMTASPVSRLSAPETVLWARVAPAALFLVSMYAAATQLLPELWRAHAWFGIVLVLMGLAAVAGFSVWNARAYDVWLSDDTLILRRGRRSTQIPLSAVTNVEVPLFQRCPMAWLHWRDPSGKRNTAQFFILRSAAWENFRREVTDRATVRPI